MFLGKVGTVIKTTGFYVLISKKCCSVANCAKVLKDHKPTHSP
jgi:predicted nucleic acid-binding Zn ribbon protein